MMDSEMLANTQLFTKTLFEIMKGINAGVADMELYEFRYSLNNICPENDDWSSVKPDPMPEIEQLVNSIGFYSSIKIKPRVEDRIVLDPKIVQLTQKLLVGLVTGQYSVSWILKHFYFDIRGFYFLHRTVYFTDKVIVHFGGKPYKSFKPKQKEFVERQDLGYKAFKEANAEVDRLFIDTVHQLIAAKGTPILLAIAGPTAAGKTEIVERLNEAFALAGKKTTSIELDNFLTDRDYREEKGIHTLGRVALHFELLKQSLNDIIAGKKITIPRYDFIFGTSSHDINGNLKPDGHPVEIEPADIIFMEGNSPFLFEEIAQLVEIKVVYLTDDEMRLKRKWKRDIDYRKKYEPSYFRNRFFKDQFIMAQESYRPQMEESDIVVDTTGASLWVTPETARLLKPIKPYKE
jgi:uridine kinase